MSRDFRPITLSFLVIGVPFAIFLVWTEVGLRPTIESLAAERLATTARVIAGVTDPSTFSDSLADQLGDEAHLRVTLIAEDGSVVGDSEVDADRIPELDNHGSRPEVVAAQQTGVGYSTRPSQSVSLSLFYVAVADRDAVVRVSMPLPIILEPLKRTRQVAILTAALALALFLALESIVRRADLKVFESLRGALRGLVEQRPEVKVDPGPGIAGGLAAEVSDVARTLGEQRAAADSRMQDLGQMLDAADSGIAAFDSSGRLVRTNRAFRDWLGIEEPRGQLVGTLFRHPGPANAVAAALEGRPVSIEVPLGTRITEVKSVPLTGGAILLLRDLTARRQLEGVRRDFVANVSHELKTPLTVMRGFAEPLAEGGMDDQQATNFAGRILANIDRMQLLVDDLLNLTQIESGKWAPSPEPMDVSMAAEAVWGDITPMAEAKAVRLRIETAGASTVVVDPDSLRQIFTNLLDNAVRYSPPDGEVVVTVSEPDDMGRLRISVRDEGPGIPSEHLLRVFERFYRVDPSRARDAGGTGLGLSIVKNLVVAHGCDVGIDSQLGAGTTVWFTLPEAEASVS